METITVNGLKPGDMFLNNEYYSDFYIKIVHDLSIDNNSRCIHVRYEFIDRKGHVNYEYCTYRRGCHVTRISI